MNRASFVVLLSSLACVAIITGCGENASFIPPTLVSIAVTPSYYPSPEPWVLVMAVPQMNLTAKNFEGQSYNFIQMENNAAQDITIGSVAIDANANLTGNGYNGELALFTPSSSSIFANLSPLTFPTGSLGDRHRDGRS